MDFSTVSIGEVLKKRLENFHEAPLQYDYGVAVSVGDGVVRLTGLSHCRYGELISFKDKYYAMALDLGQDYVGAVVLNGVNEIHVGMFARSTGYVVEVPVGELLLGRVMDPLGMPLDGRPIDADAFRPVETPAPSILDRENVTRSLETGLLAVDSMIPIGRGQRQLIIGDRQTGKTTIATECMRNQRGKGVVCVYVAIGQKASSVAQVVQSLEKGGSMEYTVVVSASASDCAAMQYIAPYAGCAVAEYFMQAGRDVLIVYDDLSKHATAYRAMSLLLRRPPGREAYPGDIFYLHSRLLERSAQLNSELGGGSLTALPIVETMAGDISAYIPTNVISITDGQIFLDTQLFHSGVRPAVNVGLSVSRVGRAAQKKAMRDVSGKLRLTLAQYRELQVFAQFGSDVDVTTRKLLDYGDRLTEALKQPPDRQYALSEQVAILLFVSNGHTDGVSVRKTSAYIKEMVERANMQCVKEMNEIDRTGELSDEVKERLLDFMERFVKIG